MSFEITEISRKLSNIIRIGKIIEVDYEKAQVRVKVGTLTTNWLDFISSRAAFDTTWDPPEINEQVVILSPDGDLSQGIVLPSLYQDAFPRVSTVNTEKIIKFKDGSILKYDSAAKQLTALLTAGGKAHITASGGLTIIGDVTITGNIAVSGTISSTGDQTAGAISQINHTHGDVEAGSDSTSAPQYPQNQKKNIYMVALHRK